MSPRKTGSKKARRRRPARVANEIDVRRVASEGRRRAKDVLATRARQNQRRARAVKAAVQAQSVSPAVKLQIRPGIITSLGPSAAAGVLIAEGDSWFDYPLHDVLDMLEDEHGFEVQSVAHHGDRVENMAFAEGQLNDFSRELEKLLRRGTVPRAILLSGGGNDVAGDQFGMLLNHAASPIAGLNADIVTGVIDKRIKAAFAFIIGVITQISEHYLTRPLPIVTHGYAHAVPDGRGFLGGFWFLPGPWLKPGFDEKGFGDLQRNTVIVEDLIDRFNEMAKSVAAEFAHVHYIDLRPVLRNESNYKRFWANELHPTKAGFSLVANEFAAAIAALP